MSRKPDKIYRRGSWQELLAELSKDREQKKEGENQIPPSTTQPEPRA